MPADVPLESGRTGGLGVDKTTKTCELDVRLKNGHRLVGQFHVAARTSSTIRPSDALMDPNRGMLLLTDVAVFEGTVQRSVDAAVVPFDAVAYIELPRQWVSRTEAPSDGRGLPVSASAPTGVAPTVTRGLPQVPAAPASPPPSVSKWLRPPGGTK